MQGPEVYPTGTFPEKESSIGCRQESFFLLQGLIGLIIYDFYTYDALFPQMGYTFGPACLPPKLCCPESSKMGWGGSGAIDIRYSIFDIRYSEFLLLFLFPEL